MCDIIFADICFISSIINNYCAYFISIINPVLKLRFCNRCSGRIIWEAKIDNVRLFFWKVWYKIILCGAWHIDDITPGFCGRVVCSCSSCHNIRININRIYWVAYCNFVIYTEYFLNISRVTFCSIADKNLICMNIAAMALIVTLCNCIS